MKLDYKIVWVEDKIDSKPFIALVKKISDYLENEFFNVTIETAEDVDEFKEKFAIHDKFDLIITDLNLNESHGDEVIDYIRDEKHIMTEVFFYSANSELKEKPLLNSNRITFYQLDTQNVYKALEKEIIELIDLTISKFQHIVSMRGMIMHETSYLDETTLDIVDNVYDTKNDDDIQNSIFDEIISFHKEKHDKAEKYKRNNRIEKILSDPLAFSASQRINTISNILDKKGFDNFVKDYKKEIISVRNMFAHAVFDDEKQIFKTKNGDEFNSESCRKIRGDIQKHMNNLESLIEKLSE